jgi:hypothetical protein
VYHHCSRTPAACAIVEGRIILHVAQEVNRGRGRRILFWLVLVVVAYALTELGAFAMVSLVSRRWFSFEELQARRQQWNAQSEAALRTLEIPARYVVRKEVVHPYLGYVHDPTVESSSPYGISDIPPIQTRAAGRVVVGFFGGSFAEDIVYHGADAMIEQLKPLFPGKEFVIVKAVMGGYKQPQQLMAFNYFTALGGEFDIVINLDGFNEIALPVAENVPNTNPFFPRQWHQRMQMLPDPALLSTIGQIQFLDTVSQTWAAFFSRAPFRYSVTMNVLWWSGEKLLYNRTLELRARLPGLVPKAAEFAAVGPPAPFQDEAEMYEALGRMWEESSFQMHVLAAAKGATYFHFLQPNQYVQGTKPMTTAERRVAIRVGHPYGRSVEGGYPVLQRLGADLADRGVNFVDLTKVFSDRSEVLYRDNCCHVNFEGNDIVGAAMGKVIAAGLKRR